ncbi:MAG: hypothetical protein ACOYCD_06200 [Kiritimatiellia bacterium]
MQTMHKGIGLNRQDAKVAEEDSPRMHAALSAMRTWIGGHPDTRMNSRIRVSADPSDRQMLLKLRQLASLSQMRGANDEAV